MSQRVRYMPKHEGPERKWVGSLGNVKRIVGEIAEVEWDARFWGAPKVVYVWELKLARANAKR